MPVSSGRVTTQSGRRKPGSGSSTQIHRGALERSQQWILGGGGVVSLGAPARGATPNSSARMSSCSRALRAAARRRWGQYPRRSRAWARRCQSRSTFTLVSRYTRAPSSASSSSRARVPASLMHRAALADDHPLLRLALDEHLHLEAQHVVVAVVGLELLGDDRDRVRQLVARDAQQLLPHQLGDEERLGLVGHHTARVVLGALGQARPRARRPARRRPRRSGPRAARRRRTRRARRSRPARCSPIAARRRRGRPCSRQDLRRVDLLHELGDEAVAGADRPKSPRRAGTRRRPRRASRGPRSLVRSPSSVRGLWMPGRVEQHELRRGRGAHAADLGARGLGAVGDDRHLGARRAGSPGRLADVGPADERDEPRAELGHGRWLGWGASATGRGRRRRRRGRARGG